MATSIRLNDDLKNRVKKLASSRHRSPHWIMCEAIAQFVEREEAHENFETLALHSWASYQETGLHLTGQEVSAWLKTWGTDRQYPIPECHK